MTSEATLIRPPTPPRFGLFLSQANKSLSQVLDEFQMAEDLGFDHAWLVDHLVDTDGPPSHPIHEAWTLLAAIAARTSRIRLGVLVTSITFRHPAVLLKSAVTVDHISAGRLILGLGTGWHVDEHRRYGIELPEPPERVDRFAEAVELISLLMAQERTTFSGRHYRLDDAPLEPRPVQTPRIPILIAAHRPRMLRLAARFADQWDTFAAMPGTATDGVESELAQRIRALDAACRDIGRDPAEVRRSTWAPAAAMHSDESYLDFVGRHRTLGFTDFSTVLPVPADLPVLRRVAAEIIPAIRAGRA
ncbi:MAG: LLM class flavin-dependent oxidoreductase [Candidatus Limnocylindrales bacterium]